MSDITKYPETLKLYKELIYSVTNRIFSTEETIRIVRLYLKSKFKYKLGIDHFDINTSDESICMLLEDHTAFFMDGYLHFRSIEEYNAFIDLFTDAVAIRNNALKDLYINNRAD